MFPLNATTISKPGVSFSSPQFSPDGKFLAFTSDETGWRSLWVAGADGSNAVRLETGEEKSAGHWIPGLISMRWSGDSRSIYTVRRHESRDAILRVTWPDRKVTVLDTQWTEVSGLNVLQDALGFIGARGTTPPALVTLDGKGRTECVRATGGVGIIDGSSLSEPKVISWKTVGGTTTWGILPRPNSGACRRAAPANCLRSRRPDFR